MASEILVYSASGNGLVLDNTKPLLEPMETIIMVSCIFDDRSSGIYSRVNSLTPGRCEWNLTEVIFNLILVTDGWGLTRGIALRWILMSFIDKSTLVQVMAWCRQATSHYLSQCWPRSMLPCGITRPQWVHVYLNTQDINPQVVSQIYRFEITAAAPRGQWVNSLRPGDACIYQWNESSLVL